MLRIHFPVMTIGMIVLWPTHVLSMLRKGKHIDLYWRELTEWFLAKMAGPGVGIVILLSS